MVAAAVAEAAKAATGVRIPLPQGELLVKQTDTYVHIHISFVLSVLLEVASQLIPCFS